MILILVAIYQTELGPHLPNSREDLFTLLVQTCTEASASSANTALQMDAAILKNLLEKGESRREQDPEIGQI
jgi:hypothetical protein